MIDKEIKRRFLPSETGSISPGAAPEEPTEPESRKSSSGKELPQTNPLSDRELAKYDPARGGVPLRFTGGKMPGTFELRTAYNRPFNNWTIEVRYKGTNEVDDILAALLTGVTVLSPMSSEAHWLCAMNYKALKKRVERLAGRGATYMSILNRLSKREPQDKLAVASEAVLSEVRKRTGLLDFRGREAMAQEIVGWDLNFENTEAAPAILDFLVGMMPAGARIRTRNLHDETVKQLDRKTPWNETPLGVWLSRFGLLPASITYIPPIGYEGVFYKAAGRASSSGAYEAEQKEGGPE